MKKNTKEPIILGKNGSTQTPPYKYRVSVTFSDYKSARGFTQMLASCGYDAELVSLDNSKLPELTMLEIHRRGFAK